MHVRHRRFPKLHLRAWLPLGLALLGTRGVAAAPELVVWRPAELPPFTASQAHAWDEFPLQVEFTHRASGRTLRVDAFWDSGRRWRVRYALPAAGEWCWEARSGDPQLRGRGCVAAREPTAAERAANPSYRGHLRVSANRRYFERADGTPFLYVGDTLWALNSLNASADTRGRGNFYRWAGDRRRKGFTLAQAAAFIEFPNEAGHAFPARVWSNLNAAFFRASDRRFAHLWEQGFVVALHPTWITTTDMRLPEAVAVSRYVYARYGAYSLVWSLTGEYNLDHAKPYWREDRFAALRALGREMQAINERAYRHPMSVHPAGGNPAADGAFSSHYVMHREPWLDHNWLQTYRFVERVVPELQRAYRTPEPKPVVLAEPCYENAGDCDADTMRLQAWTAFLAGAAGFVYGAEGVYYLDDVRALRLPGSRHMKHLVDFFRRLEWWTLDPTIGCVRFEGDPPEHDMPAQPRCAGNPGHVFVVYIPSGSRRSRAMEVIGLVGGSYAASWFDPRSGRYRPLRRGPRAVDSWRVPRPPDDRDWVLLLERR
ncbi:MAG TPA: DUF4038 domain-containing protein [Burkholderiales bacterium]